VAVKLYQTSEDELFPQLPGVADGNEYNNVPLVAEQLPPGVNDVGAAQLSLGVGRIGYANIKSTCCTRTGIYPDIISSTY
jgi:hypothetical protein